MREVDNFLIGGLSQISFICWIESDEKHKSVQKHIQTRSFSYDSQKYDFVDTECLAKN